MTIVKNERYLSTMTHINELVEQHILQHESRLKHIDELLKRTQKTAQEKDRAEEADAELQEIRQTREKLHSHIQDLKHSPEHWTKEALERAGPMGVWDAVAQRLETLVERIEGKAKPN